MNVLGRNLLTEFSEKHANVKSALEAWFHEACKAEWKTPQDIKNRYRSADFLDPKSRAKATGVEYAQALIALGGDDEDLARENVKDDLGGKGEITLTVDAVDADTDEFGGQFVAIQPSDNDLGSKDPVDIKIKGIFYGRKA